MKIVEFQGFLKNKQNSSPKFPKLREAMAKWQSGKAVVLWFKMALIFTFPHRRLNNFPICTLLIVAFLLSPPKVLTFPICTLLNVQIIRSSSDYLKKFKFEWVCGMAKTGNLSPSFFSLSPPSWLLAAGSRLFATRPERCCTVFHVWVRVSFVPLFFLIIMFTMMKKREFWLVGR